jgi:endo-1,4-beta-D-glucanase Y
MSNTGAVCIEPATNEWVQKAECFAHFSYEKSSNKLMVVDIQGTDHMLYDPEIASAEQFDNNELVLHLTYLSPTIYATTTAKV